MLDLLSSGLVSLWLDLAGVKSAPKTQLVWQSTPQFVLPSDPDPAAAATVEQFLQSWGTKGWSEAQQGIWIQSGHSLLASNQGQTPLPAASLTKVATTLAALETWGPKHQFETLVSATGPITNGVVQGDLVITGSDDPFFVWEEAIALGNALHKLGVIRVTGNLVIVGRFAMNYESDPAVTGEMLKQGINSAVWTDEIEAQHQSLSVTVPRPLVAIAGTVKTTNAPPANQTLLLRHKSMPLAEILKRMNIYSNNLMAEMLAEAMGGATVVKDRVSQAAGIPAEEILIVNGSGLGVENRISPRAVAAMFMTIQRQLEPYQISVADLFPVTGRDAGTAADRRIVTPTVIKTGTLWDVSALAGVLPTRDRGLVWFTIINRGDDIDGFRVQQDQLLNQLLQQWGTNLTPTPILAPSPILEGEAVVLGAPGRNELLLDPQAKL